MFGFLRGFRRNKLAAQPLPAGWDALVARFFPFVKGLEAGERERFFTHLKVFAAEKNWEGAQGFTVTDEMKVVVSGCAARLARNLPLDVYDDLVTVLLYEGAWRPREGDGTTLGEAHRWGLVVLAWDAVRRGLKNPFDGHDTALHELAHVLDLTDGRFDGTPEQEHWSDYHAWASVFSAHCETLRGHPGRKNVLRAYGATNEAEFFAVATEAFFEKPRQLQAKQPDLYAELKDYYRQDPAALSRGTGSGG